MNNLEAATIGDGSTKKVDARLLETGHNLLSDARGGSFHSKLISADASVPPLAIVGAERTAAKTKSWTESISSEANGVFKGVFNAAHDAYDAAKTAANNPYLDAAVLGITVGGAVVLSRGKFLGLAERTAPAVEATLETKSLGGTGALIDSGMPIAINRAADSSKHMLAGEWQRRTVIRGFDNYLAATIKMEASGFTGVDELAARGMPESSRAVAPKN